MDVTIAVRLLNENIIYLRISEPTREKDHMNVGFAIKGLNEQIL